MVKDIYIVTGANGFLGNNIVCALKQKPDCQVRVLVSSMGRADLVSISL